MVLGRILSFAFVGIVGAYILNTLIRPAEAIQSGAALEATGQGIGGLGQGIGDFISSVGSSAPRLFDSLFTLKDLVYDSNVSGAANTSPVAQISGETNQGVNRPSSSTITWSSGTTASVPTLSAAAKSFYSSRGVSVT